MFLVWLKCNLGKRNKERFHLNRGDDIAPEAKDYEFDPFVRCNFLIFCLRVCENFNDLYVKEAWVFTTTVEYRLGLDT